MNTPLEVDIIEAARLFSQGDKVLLDVREPEEYAICHIPGSLHIPMVTVPGRLAELPRDQHILVLCHHGGRSMRVAQFLWSSDFPLVTNVAGGIDAWASAIDPSLPRY